LIEVKTDVPLGKRLAGTEINLSFYRRVIQ